MDPGQFESSYLFILDLQNANRSLAAKGGAHQFALWQHRFHLRSDAHGIRDERMEMGTKRGRKPVLGSGELLFGDQQWHEGKNDEHDVVGSSRDRIAGRKILPDRKASNA